MRREREGSVVFYGGRLAVPGKRRLCMAVFALLVTLFVFALFADPAWAQTTLSVVKDDLTEPVEVGNVITYEIDVTNTGGATAENVVLRDPLPDNTTFVSASVIVGTGTCTTPDPGDSSGTIRCDLGNIPSTDPDTTETVEIQVRPTAEAGDVGFVDNTARARADNADEVEESERTNVAPSDIVLTKDDAPNTVQVDGLLSYLLEVTNGEVAGQPLTVIDELPEGVEFLSANPSQGTCTQSGDEVTCNLGTVGAGETETIQIFVEPQQEGTITNFAEVFLSSDLNTPLDQATENTTVEGSSSPSDDSPSDDSPVDDFFPPGVFDDFNPDDLEDAENDLNSLDETTNGEGTVSSDDQYGSEGTTGDGGATAISGDPDTFTPETSTRGNVVDEIPTEGPLPNTGGASLWAFALPALGFLLLGSVLLRRFRR